MQVFPSPREAALRGGGERRDFFISYAGPDRLWARWVAAELETDGFLVELDEWDWPPGSDALLQMNSALQRADRVLALWSPSYFDPESWAGKELSAAMYQAHRSQTERLVPVLVEEVVPPPIFQPLVTIKLAGLSEPEARRELLTRLGRQSSSGRAAAPGAPALGRSRTIAFPGSSALVGTAHATTHGEVAVLPPSNLPMLEDRFIGRDAELADCRGLVLGEGCRLLTIVGFGGIGKTRFAQQLARTMLNDFDSHVYFVDLTAVTDPNLVVTSITRALRIEAGDPVIEALKQLFREQRALLLLDNFEQVMTAALTVRELLEAGSLLHVVVTSWEPLHIRGESLFELRPLGRAEAVKLFVTRAPAAQETDPDVARLCERLDDLPLAIELVAARARLHSPRTLLTMLDESLLDLPATRRDAPARHRTLRATLRWGYELLDEPQQQLFRQLSVFQGGCTLDSAAAVLWPVGTPQLVVSDALVSLLESSLLREELMPDPRLGMPQMLHQFSRELLETDPHDSAEIRRRHAEHFLDLAEEAAAQLTSSGQSSAFQRLESEQENLRAALAHFIGLGDAEGALRLAAALGHYWWSRDYREGWERLGEVLSLSCPDPVRHVKARVLKARGQVAIRLALLREAAALFDEMLSLARACGDVLLEAIALGRIALVAMEHAEFARAQPLLERARSLQEASEDTEGLADTLDSLGVIATGEGRYDQARDLLRSSQSAYRTVGDQQGEAWVLNDLARVALARGDLQDAAAAAAAAWTTGQHQKDWGLIAWARNYLGHVAARRGNYTEARDHHTESLSLVSLLGDQRPIALALEGFAALAGWEGDAARALTLDSAAAELRATVGIPRTKAEAALLEPALERARAALSASQRDEAIAAGRVMSFEQAVLLARTA